MTDTNETPAARSTGEGRTREILRARAHTLARQGDQVQTPADSFEVVEFLLAKERYAVEQGLVQEVCPLHALTPLPCVPGFILGIINVRGQILPVIDIKKFFDLPDTGITDIHMVIIVRADDVELGILADAIMGVRTIRRDALQASLPTLTGIRADYLKGVTADSIVVLDVSKILSDPKVVVDDEVKS